MACPNRSPVTVPASHRHRRTAVVPKSTRSGAPSSRRPRSSSRFCQRLPRRRRWRRPSRRRRRSPAGMRFGQVGGSPGKADTTAGMSIRPRRRPRWARRISPVSSPAAVLRQRLRLPSCPSAGDTVRLLAQSADEHSCHACHRRVAASSSALDRTRTGIGKHTTAGAGSDGPDETARRLWPNASP